MKTQTQIPIVLDEIEKIILAKMKEIDHDPVKSLKLTRILDSIERLLLEKNKRYGDSALNPLKVFSNIDPNNKLYVRLDEKLQRVMNSDHLRKNDIVDIIGYLVLVAIDEDWLDFDDLID